MTTTASQGKRRRRTRPYPQRTLEYCLEVVEAVYRDGAGGAMDRVVLAGKLGTTPASSAFVIRLGSCERYGLSDSSGGIVELTARGEAAAAPSSPDERQAALLGAALEPELFRSFYEAYDGQKLPADEMARNMLRRDLGVEEDLTAECLEVSKGERNICGVARRRPREPLRQRARGPRRPAARRPLGTSWSRVSHRSATAVGGAERQGHTNRTLRSGRRCPDRRVDPGIRSA